MLPDFNKSNGNSFLWRFVTRCDENLTQKMLKFLKAQKFIAGVFIENKSLLTQIHKLFAIKNKPVHINFK